MIFDIAEDILNANDLHPAAYADYARREWPAATDKQIAQAVFIARLGWDELETLYNMSLALSGDAQ